MVVPAVPEVGVKDEITGALATAGGVKLNTPPADTNSTVCELGATKVTVIRPLDDPVSTTAVIVVLFTTDFIGTLMRLRPTLIDCRVNPAPINPVPEMVIVVPAVPDVGVNPVTESVSTGTGVEVSRTGAPGLIVIDPPPSGTVTTILAVKVSNRTEMTGATVA
jgi:hypothetical protein